MFMIQPMITICTVPGSFMPMEGGASESMAQKSHTTINTQLPSGRTLSELQW